MATLLEGKQVAQTIYERLMGNRTPTVPKLSVVLVGEDPASQTYVNSKAKRCEILGFKSEVVRLPIDTTTEKLLQTIERLNADGSVHGILVQLPLPAHLDPKKVIDSLDPMKDVDGLCAENAGLLLQGRPRFAPCTPAGIIEMLKFYKTPIAGKSAVVLGRSEIVGKPMAQLLLQENATVTICHSKTADIRKESLRADILVVAIGKPNYVTAEFVGPQCTVIDVGIHRVGDRLVGDVEFASVSPKVKAISPVPGGVGPLTIAMLMSNVAHAARLKASDY